MMLNLKRRLEEGRDRESGFTLIELAVVILIMGILMLIAIPTFLGVRKNAQNKSAQSSVRNGLTAAKASAADNQTYAGMLAATIQAAEPGLTVSANGPSTGPRDVSMFIDVPNGNTIVLAARSQSGDCYLIRDSLDDNGTAASKQFAKSINTTAATCKATLLPFNAAGWGVKW